jgi:hypothetical protein
MRTGWDPTSLRRFDRSFEYFYPAPATLSVAMRMYEWQADNFLAAAGVIITSDLLRSKYGGIRWSKTESRR